MNRTPAFLLPSLLVFLVFSGCAEEPAPSPATAPSAPSAASATAAVESQAAAPLATHAQIAAQPGVAIYDYWAGGSTKVELSLLVRCDLDRQPTTFPFGFGIGLIDPVTQERAVRLYPFGGPLEPPNALVTLGGATYSLDEAYSSFQHGVVDLTLRGNVSASKEQRFISIAWFFCLHPLLTEAQFNGTRGSVRVEPVEMFNLESMHPEFYEWSAAGVIATNAHLQSASTRERDVIVAGHWSPTAAVGVMVDRPLYHAEQGAGVVFDSQLQSDTPLYARLGPGTYEASIRQLTYLDGWADVYTFLIG